MDIAIILALALVALAAALLAWAWRRNHPPCATCRHQYKRYEWSNGRTAYSCRLRRGNITIFPHRRSSTAYFLHT